MEFTYNIKENKKTNKDIDNNCHGVLGNLVQESWSYLSNVTPLLCRPESHEECGIIEDDKRSPQS